MTAIQAEAVAKAKGLGQVWALPAGGPRGPPCWGAARRVRRSS